MTEKDPIPDELPAIVRDKKDTLPVVFSVRSLCNPDIMDGDLSMLFRDAVASWMSKSPSKDTQSNYARDLQQFCEFAGARRDSPEDMARIRPRQVTAWRDHLVEQGMTNSTIRRKLTVLRSLFAFLQTYGFRGKNPAHRDFVPAPPVPRDGKTVGLSPAECRLMLDAPDADAPAGVRDRAILAVLAYSACRVGELVKLKVGDYKASCGHKVLEITGKGDKERHVPLHHEVIKRIDEWIAAAELVQDLDGPLFRPAKAARGKRARNFHRRPISRRAVQLLVERLVERLGLEPSVSVHSFRVTALTTARERGADIVDLQDFAGHADPRTTLTYIRNRNRLDQSPTYRLVY